MVRINGHVALLPMIINHNRAHLRGGDPLPGCGTRSRQQSITSIHNLGCTLHIQQTHTKHAVFAALTTTS